MKSEGLKHVMQKGLILGFIFTLNFILSSVLGNVFFSFLSLCLSVGIIYITVLFVKNYRDSFFNGVIKYFQAVYYVMLLYFFAALISSAFKYIYFQYINTEYLSLLLEQTFKIADIYKITISDVDKEAMQIVLTPASFSLQYVWINSFFGIIVGLIVGVFVKKNNTTFTN